MGQHIAWYAVKVSYCRELKVKEYLDSQNIESFIPMQYKQAVINGDPTDILQPAVHNLIFVHAPKRLLDEITTEFKTSLPLRYIYNPTTQKPAIIPDAEMQRFITVCKLLNEPLIYLSEIGPSLLKGERVRVTGGVFAGIEGRVVRIKNDKRVLVSIEGVVAVATSHIPSSLLEKIEPDPLSET